MKIAILRKVSNCALLQTTHVVVADVVYAHPPVASDWLGLLERHLRGQRPIWLESLVERVANLADSGNSQVPQVRVVVLDVFEELTHCKARQHEATRTCATAFSIVIFMGTAKSPPLRLFMMKDSRTAG